MTVLQQYYTSFVNKETGSAGFQVKAMSRDISPETQAIISRLIAYRIPSSLDVRAVETHPIALRYYYHNTKEGILLCSQSSGRDESGRPGNFFAHSVVMPPDSFTTEPPFLYWHSPFWRKQSPETAPISPLSTFPAEQSLNILDKMWVFLAEEGRRDAFYKLMCAVVQSESANKRIVIIDSDEHVALWVAAVSCMLPPSYRPLLSFATYHHDPYQSWFLITGTTSDSGIRVSPEESVSHFVLDGQTNRTSDVKFSYYAELVKRYTYPEAYDAHLLRFFAAYEKRFPVPERIDEQLDKFALYVWLLQKEEHNSLRPEMMETIDTALTAFEQLSIYTEEDIQELEILREKLEIARKKSSKTEVQEAYNRVMHLYKNHGMPTEAFLKSDLEHYAPMLLGDVPQPTQADAIVKIQQLRQTYGETAFVQHVNAPTFLQFLTELAQQEPARHQLVWTYIGPYFRPSAHLRKLFLSSLQIWGAFLVREQINEENALFSPLREAIKERELEWLQLLTDAETRPPDFVITYFYWKIVASLTLEQREPYRSIIQSIIPTTVDKEFDYDLLAADLSSMVAVLNRWVAYTQRSQIKAPNNVVQDGLRLLQERCNERQWKQLALQLLMSDYIAPLLKEGNTEWEAPLVKKALSEPSLQQFSQERLKLYQRYHDYDVLPETARTVLAGMVAMSEGHLDAALSNRLYNYVSTLAPQDYNEEIRCFMSKFLKTDLTAEAHLQMINALFVWPYEHGFWLSYWEILQAMLLRLSTQELEQALRLLSFWFDLSPEQLARPYVTHRFFLTLRQNLRTAQVLPEFQQAIVNIETKATIYAWYPCIQELLVTQRGGILSSSIEFVKQVQKFLPGQKGVEEIPEHVRKLNEEVSALLGKGTICEQHVQHLTALYPLQPREQFWATYWEQFVQLLLSHDADHIMECFSFWFDESFHHLQGQEAYIAQSFFIGLPQVCEIAKRSDGVNFRKTAQLISACYVKAKQEQQPHYDWYPSIQPFLIERTSPKQRLPLWLRPPR